MTIGKQGTCRLLGHAEPGDKSMHGFGLALMNGYSIARQEIAILAVVALQLLAIGCTNAKLAESWASPDYRRWKLLPAGGLLVDSEKRRQYSEIVTQPPG